MCFGIKKKFFSFPLHIMTIIAYRIKTKEQPKQGQEKIIA